jgi:hypothetical protein
VGYRIHSDRELRPAMQSLNRLLVGSRRLYEQGVDENRLHRYRSTMVHGYTVDYATGSVTQVALTGYGYLY